MAANLNNSQQDKGSTMQINKAAVIFEELQKKR